MNKTKTTGPSLVDQINAGYVSTPGETMTIISHEGTIADSISIDVDRPLQSTRHYSLPNNIVAWRWLRRFNDIGGRRVVEKRIMHDGTETITPLTETPAFIHRFGETDPHREFEWSRKFDKRAI